MMNEQEQTVLHELQAQLEQAQTTLRETIVERDTLKVQVAQLQAKENNLIVRVAAELVKHGIRKEAVPSSCERPGNGKKNLTAELCAIKGVDPASLIMNPS
jgi:hypothetical protein